MTGEELKHLFKTGMLLTEQNMNKLIDEVKEEIDKPKIITNEQIEDKSII